MLASRHHVSRLFRTLRRPLLAAGLLSLGLAAAFAQVDPGLLRGLSWRSIGPAHFSARVDDIAGVPGDPNVIYVGFASSGLYKSENGGITFRPVLDQAASLSIGAIAVDPAHPDTVYAGMGEGNPRNDISFGDGVYKTTDGGKSWSHTGLGASERISRIVIDPHRPEVVYVAAMGHAFGGNRERGLFRSGDGGRTWEQVLFVNETTGASDVALDPRDPDIVYCGMYDYLRQPWHFRSGGPGSGLFRSADGGRTWTKLTDPTLANGLPGKRPIGRIGVAVSPGDPDIVYAMIEAAEPGRLWRSNDRGLHWGMVSDSEWINNRPFYYTALRVDPADANRVYAMAGAFTVSADGGRTWAGVAEYDNIFGDNHCLWIDPRNPRRMLLGNDGGAYLSNDRGRTWNFLNNMPAAQAYHVGADMAEPYNVMGGFQDHEIWVGPGSKWNEVGVRGGDWRRLRYMADGMYALADPRDPDLLYYSGHFGDITRIDLRNAEERYIQPYPVGPTGTGAHMDAFRFNWNAPVHMSPTNPDVVYYGGNVVFKTEDKGQSWRAISPDLTGNDKSKQQLSGGPISPDNTRAEWYGTILSMSESPLDPRVLWATTDDGHVQLTRDGGGSWTELSANVGGLPDQAYVGSVAASPHAPGRACITVDEHRLDDPRPYAFKTGDFGKTWTAIGRGLDGWVHIVREDPRTPGLLYAGTERGVFASFDDGAHWTDIDLGTRLFAAVDLLVHPRDNDLVVGTHSRGFYILDDVTPLQMIAGAANEAALLCPPVPPVRYTPASDTSTLGDQVFVAPNKPYGAIISYWLAAAEPGGRVELSVLDGAGKTLSRFDGPGEMGINRVVWDLCEDLVPEGDRAEAGPYIRFFEGFKVLPGLYTIRLQAAGRTLERPLAVRPDPRFSVSDSDWKLYETAVRRMLRMTLQIETTLVRAETSSGKLARMEKQAAPGRRKEIGALRTALDAARFKLQPPRLQPENLNLRGKLSWLLRQVRNFSGRPTQSQAETIDLFDRQLQDVLREIGPVFERIEGLKQYDPA